MTSTLPGERVRPTDAPIHEMVRRYERLLYSVTRRYGLSQADADDVVQRTWIQYLQHSDDIRDRRVVASWLCTTARRECFATRRNLLREAPYEELPRLAALPDVADEVVGRDDAEHVRMAIQALPPRERELMAFLTHDSEPSYLQASHALSIPVGSIGPVRARAMRRLRLSLADLREDRTAAPAIPQSRAG
jgi:RNA polymerase sigma factor (sigma-70 family)